MESCFVYRATISVVIVIAIAFVVFFMAIVSIFITLLTIIAFVITFHVTSVGAGCGERRSYEEVTQTRLIVLPMKRPGMR